MQRYTICRKKLHIIERINDRDGSWSSMGHTVVLRAENTSYRS